MSTIYKVWCEVEKITNYGTHEEDYENVDMMPVSVFESDDISKVMEFVHGL